MNHNLEIFLGCLMLAYGLAKLIIGFIACFFSPEMRKKAASFKILGLFLNDDMTIAGKAFNFALMIFGMYSVIHGLVMIHVLPQDISEFVMKRHIMYYINGIIGICLIVFYSLVLFTNVKIPKMEEHKHRYMIEGLCSGLMFVIMLPIFAITHEIHDHGINQVNWFNISIYTVCIVLLSALLFSIIKKVYADEDKNGAIHGIATLVMIPLASVT
jgi:MFS family permease